jgi:hypothetical protein
LAGLTSIATTAASGSNSCRTSSFFAAASKPHLIEGAKIPDSYIEFLKHYSSWEITHRRWKEQGVEYNWHSEVSWPTSFENDILNAFAKIKERHAALLGQLGEGEK